ncbi:MAG: GHKL domain-containing protein [Ruminococcus sp.]|nr:GHKL domain-containing protein [Ruminococcus sp.]
MNMNLAVRYFLDFSIIIPAAVIAIFPVYRSLRVKKPFMFGLLALLLTSVILAGTVSCTLLGTSSNSTIFPSMIIFFFAYDFCFDLSFQKKLFAFVNAVKLIAFVCTYCTFLTAPSEIGNTERVFTAESGLIRLGAAFLLILVFARTFAVKFPYLFETESLDSAWKVLVAASSVTTLAVIWMNPVSYENVMVGRLRKICLVVLLSIPVIIWFLYHMFWWLARKITETAKLQNSYDLLKMEEKQYRKTRKYLQESREQRHDFRQHILVINELLQSRQTEKLKEYISPIVTAVSRNNKEICINQAVDAIACYYDDMAQQQNIEISWSVDLPDEIPVKEADMCGIIGNLVENAILAVSNLEGDNRIINVRIGMLSEETLVLSLYNPYQGNITIGSDGLPVVKKANHGFGLRSVKNTVESYNGSMELEINDNIFSINIIMYGEKNSV